MSTWLDRFARGSVVYSNGSTAPTRGRVKPAGYIQREMRNWRRNAANIQSRSGLAQNALARRGVSRTANRRKAAYKGGMTRQQIQKYIQQQLNQHNNTPFNNAGRPVGNQDLNSKTQGALSQYQPAAGQHNTSPFNNTGRPYVGGAKNVNDVRGSLTTSPTGVQPEQQSVKVNPDGTLELPYDANASWDMLNAQQDANQQLIGLNQEAQQQQLQYAANKRQSEMDYANLNRDTLNGAAGRGMAFSSLYGNAVANNADNYNTYRNMLDSQNASYNQGVEAQRSAIMNGINNMLRMSALQQAQKLEGQAGNLGYGKATAAPVRMNSKAPKPSRSKPRRRRHRAAK